VPCCQTTLVITPPALVGQWADELSAHAPDLKVFVYEGWAKLKVPITEADVEAEMMKRRPAAAKQKSRYKQNRTANAGAMQDNNTTRSEAKLDAGANDQNPDDPDPVLDWTSYINQFDVCITTYDVLRADTFVVHAPRERPRRQGTDYKQLRQPRSPLVMCEWYRVIMDEVQMGTAKSMFVYFISSISQGDERISY
jgi:E3 ubiquitin-protein ligase SHPRH